MILNFDKGFIKPALKLLIFNNEHLLNVIARLVSFRSIGCYTESAAAYISEKTNPMALLQKNLDSRPLRLASPYRIPI